MANNSTFLTPRRKYIFLTTLMESPVRWWLKWRMLKGKEDKKRFGERFGIASKKRPNGQLIWFHAASVGEANSVLLLITHIKKAYPQYHILLTTGTVTSARLMKTRLPKGVIHQYVPVDLPDTTNRFIYHWKPDIAIWVESEFWPNLIYTARDTGCFMLLVNGRMSHQSYHSWKRFPELIKELIHCFDYIYAQSDFDAVRLQGLSRRNIEFLGNLKYDAALLPCNENELVTLQQAIGTRPVWLAASTHDGEEAMIARAHSILALRRPNLLTIIVPRHPQRGDAVAALLRKKHQVAQRSRKQPVAPHVQFYVADTIGELGLFYRLSEIVFMGGSLVEHGGQNPLEAARLSCAIITGPHTANFYDTYRDMEDVKAIMRTTGPENLAAAVDHLLNNADTRNVMQTAAKGWVDYNSGAITNLMNELQPVFDPKAAIEQYQSEDV
jgi:3-deoxy-D-manno-octulosonic-acid transferase